MHINLLNLPVAVATILIRKLLDSQVAAVVTPKIIPGGLGGAGGILNPNIIYIYMIGAGITYIGSHLKKGTINMGRRSTSELNLSGNCVMKNIWLRRNNSWIMKNLLSTRENQQKALSYLSTQIPNSTEEVKEELLKLENAKNATCSSQKSNECSHLKEFVEDVPKLVIDKKTTANLETIGDKAVIEAKPQTRNFSATTFISVNKYESCLPTNKDELNLVENCIRFHDQGDYATNYENNYNDENLSDSTIKSAFDFYTPSVIREILPSDCDEAGVEPALPTIGRLRVTKKRKPQAANRRKAKALDIRKTRSGRIYNRGTPCLGRVRKT